MQRALILLLVAGTAIAAPPPPPASGREAIERFEINARAFPHYTCKFSVTSAEASTFEDALAGRWFNVVTSNCILLVDGKKELFTARQPPTQAGGFTLVDFDYLGDERLGLVIGRGLVGAYNLHTPDLPFDPDFESPLGAGQNFRYRAIGNPDRTPKDTEVVFTDEGPGLFDGRPVARVRFTHTYRAAGRTSRHDESYHLDPARGFLPAYRSSISGNIKTLDGRPFSQHYLLAARDCGNGRWFLERLLTVRAIISPGGTHLIQELRVTALDLNRPAADEFKLSLPAGALIVLASDAQKHIQLENATAIRPEDLPAIEADVNPTPGLLAQMWKSAMAWRWIVVVAGLAMILGLFLARRALRRATRSVEVVGNLPTGETTEPKTRYAAPLPTTSVNLHQP